MEANTKSFRIVAVSDTHNSFPQLPAGDIFIHCGDLTLRGSLSELETVCGYIKSLPFKHKIVVPGNHDVCLDEKNYARLRSKFVLKDDDGKKARQKLRAVCTLLEHEWTEVEGIRIFGSPFTPEFHNWGFMYNEQEAKSIWDIGSGPLDILVTHGPPYSILDDVSGSPEGCPELFEMTKRLRPKHHFFGHIHECYGTVKNEHTAYHNCSSKNLAYKLVKAPIVIDYPI